MCCGWPLGRYAIGYLFLNSAFSAAVRAASSAGTYEVVSGQRRTCMIEASIAVGNAEDLVLLLGTKDQHLRQIRGSIPAKITTRDGKVVVQGEEDAVIKATAVLEELRAT